MIKHGGAWSDNIRLDFSANINPLGLPAGVKKILMERIDDFSKYPDASCADLKRAIAKKEGAKHIVCGNGAADLIYRAVAALKPKKALVVTPAFGEYEKALYENGCEIKRCALEEQEDFRFTERILDEIHGIDMMFLCSPNNPNGAAADDELIFKAARKCRETGAYLMLDRCFAQFSEKRSASPRFENVITLNAFTKIYAMAGLRLGYAVCGDKNTARVIENAGQSWSVSVPAQLAGAEALKDDGYIEKTARLIAREREYMSGRLKKLGFKVYPSDANFILFRTRLPLEEALLKKGIAIRGCGDFAGLTDEFFRAAVRGRAENEELIRAVEEICALNP